MKRPKYVTRSTSALVFLSVIFGAAGAWFYLQSGPPAKNIRNVLLISIDTCRADHLSCYGYPYRTTPNIDQLARESVLFTHTYSSVPMTLPAHGSMLTGTIPPYHGIHDNHDYKLGESNLTLAEILSRKGFVTGAVVSAFVVDSQFGLDQGFDSYNDRFDKPVKTLETNERRGEEASRLAMEWLESHGNEQFFLFLHYYDPHTLYQPPEPFASRFYDNLYAGEIAYTDYCIGQVIEKLKDMGLYESTLIIITGDHGEMLGEHGENDHMYFIYQSAVRVPLIFRLPGQTAGRRITDPVGIIDIVPTVCAVLGIELPDHIQGQDLSGYFQGRQPSGKDRSLYCESLYPTKYGAGPLLGVVADRWKYIQTTRPELYDLDEDPGETNNLATRQPHRARLLQDRLRQILEVSVRKHGSDSSAPLDEEGKKRLESLGYLAGAGVKEDFEFDQSVEDPKDLIDFHHMNGAAQALVRQEKFAEAEIIYKKILHQRPQAFDVHYYLARIASAQGDFAGAASYLTEAVRLRPEESRERNELGNALLKLNRTDEAIEHFEEAMRLRPEKHLAYGNLGFALMQQGKNDQAMEYLEKALEIYPAFADAHNNLGNIKAARGRLDDAFEHFSEAVRINPNFEKAYNNMGNVFFVKGDLHKALSHYSEALRIKPGYAEAHNGMGVVLANQGRTDEAIKHFSEALHINPGYKDARNNLERVSALRGK